MTLVQQPVKIICIFVRLFCTWKYWKSEQANAYWLHALSLILVIDRVLEIWHWNFFHNIKLINSYAINKLFWLSHSLDEWLQKHVASAIGNYFRICCLFFQWEQGWCRYRNCPLPRTAQKYVHRRFLRRTTGLRHRAPEAPLPCRAR